MLTRHNTLRGGCQQRMKRRGRIVADKYRGSRIVVQDSESGHRVPEKHPSQIFNSNQPFTDIHLELFSNFQIYDYSILYSEMGMLGLFDYKYLNEPQIKGFDKYKYCCVDTSPLSKYVSHPFWNWIVQFYPTWLAPNVLTLTGFLFVMFAFLVVSYYDYYVATNSNILAENSGSIPNWVWLICSICTFIGHTLDGTDGKQARRIGVSGPTGELFDHGLDSWSTVPLTLTIFSLFGQGEFSVSPVRLLLILISVQAVFIVSHWEKYNTGILFLPWNYDLRACSFYLFAFFKGYEYFKFYVFGAITIALCFEFGFYVCCYASFVVSARNIYLCYLVDRTGKQDNFYEICLPLYPSLILFSISMLWALYSPGKIAERDPRFYLYTMGTVFSNIACRLIIAQMCNTRAETFNLCLAIYSVIAVSSLSAIHDEGSNWNARIILISSRSSGQSLGYFPITPASSSSISNNNRDPPIADYDIEKRSKFEA
ncbi:Selenoprotein I [Dirofilaria immitis]|nr:Selenoprotein I [Dirofilaria immitis]